LRSARAIGEFHTENQFWQLVVAVKTSPIFLHGFDEFEDQVLSDLLILRGIPGHVRSGNGPEFVAK
jgi:hypothetical protein